MKITTRNDRAITFVGAMIILAFLVAITGLFLAGIAKLARKIDNSGGGSGNTNAPAAFTFEEFTDSIPVGMFTFEIPAEPWETPESVAASIQLVVIERSTNLVDWQPIYSTTNLSVLSDPASVDTNRPWPMAFYRGMIRR